MAYIIRDLQDLRNYVADLVDDMRPGSSVVAVFIPLPGFVGLDDINGLYGGPPIGEAPRIVTVERNATEVFNSTCEKMKTWTGSISGAEMSAVLKAFEDPEGDPIKLVAESLGVPVTPKRIRTLAVTFMEARHAILLTDPDAAPSFGDVAIGPHTEGFLSLAKSVRDRGNFDVGLSHGVGASLAEVFAERGFWAACEAVGTGYSLKARRNGDAIQVSC